VQTSNKYKKTYKNLAYRKNKILQFANYN